MEIFWITDRIAQGGQPAIDLINYTMLYGDGITHVLDFSGYPLPSEIISLTQPHVIQEPIHDYQLIPHDQLIQCLVLMHDILTQLDTKLYIHCMAGHGRSPTIVWLYLVACGISPEAAQQQIQSKNTNSSPGGEGLVDHTHILFAKKYGQDHGWQQ